MKHNRRRSPGKPRVSPACSSGIEGGCRGDRLRRGASFGRGASRSRGPEPIQSVSTFTADLERLAAWLTGCRVTSVAMEATGVTGFRSRTARSARL